MFFSLVPHHELGPHLVGTTMDMLGESSFMSKNPPSIGDDKKSTNCSTLIGYSTSSVTYVDFFSTCSSSSKSVIITNVGA
jgi:hypothetical protein